MDGWTRCPQCNLSHTRRPDGRCPRCHAALEPLLAVPAPAPPAPPQPPPVWTPPEPSAAPPSAWSPPPGAPPPAGAPAPTWSTSATAGSAGSVTLAVGSTLGLILGRWKRNLLPFTLLGAVANLPFTLWSLRWTDNLRAGTFETLSGSFVVGMLVALAITLVLSPLVSGAMALVTSHQLLGDRAEQGEALAQAVRRLAALVGLYLLVGLAVVGTACTVVLPALLLSGWAAALPGVVLEGRGPVDALRRSWAMTRGHRLSIFAVFLVVGIGIWLASMAVEVPVLVLTFAAGGVVSSFGQLARFIVNALLSSLMVIGPVVVYHQLRALRGETDASRLARVFE